MRRDRGATPTRTGATVAVAVLVLAALTMVPARADAGGHSPRVSAPPEDAALALLNKAARVEGGRAYEGVRLISAWTPSGTSTILLEVSSLPGQGKLVRELGAGPSGAGVVEEHSAVPAADRRADRVMALLVDNYRLAVAGTGAVLGRTAYLVNVRRSDGSLAACFWIDRKTGLMLRREVRDRRGRTMRVSTFVRFATGAPTDREVRRGALPPSAPEPWRNRLDEAELTSLRQGGWTLPRTLPGGLTLVEARRDAVGGEPVVHVSYSDGLSMVSLFVQRGTLATQRLQGWQRSEIDGRVVYRQHTIPRRVVWYGDGQVYTVVADAPPQVIRNVVSALPQASRSSRFLDRIGRGFSQMGAWVNPLG